MPPRNLWELLINVKVMSPEQQEDEFQKCSRHHLRFENRFLEMVKTHVLQLLDGGWMVMMASDSPMSLLLCVCTLQKGTYLPQTYIIHEEMVVTGKVHNMRQLGPFIYRLCQGKDTYRLSRRVSQRRECGKLNLKPVIIYQVSLVFNL